MADSEPPLPLYVGKALPSGQRKGAGRQTQAEYNLFQRLKQHAQSIASAENLVLTDFRCRYLVVEPVWISLAERFLIEHYRPVRNLAVEGFGNHPVGRYRETGARPAWDIIHPGRAWASRLPANRSVEEVWGDIERHLGSGG